MTGLNAHVGYLYPRWVLCMGNGALICLSRQPLGLFASFLLQWSFLIIKETSKFTQFGALAGQVQHMAAQK